MTKCVRLLIVSALAGALLVCSAGSAQHPRTKADEPRPRPSTRTRPDASRRTPPDSAPQTDAAKGQRWHLIVLEFVGEDVDRYCVPLAETSMQLGWSKPDTVMEIRAWEFASIKAVIEKFGPPDQKIRVRKQEKEGERKVAYDGYRFDENFFLYTKSGSDAVVWLAAPAGWLKEGIRKVAKREADKSAAAKGPEPAEPGPDLAQLTRALDLLGSCDRFQLVGKSAGAAITAEEIEVIRADGAVTKHLEQTLLEKPLAASLHDATSYLARQGPKGCLQQLIVKGSKMPTIADVQKLLGNERSKEMRGAPAEPSGNALVILDADPATIEWYDYGWLRFGVLKGNVILVIAGLAGPDVGAAEGAEKLPCALSVVGIKTQEDAASVTLEFTWAKEVPGLKQGDMTVVVLFQPKLVAPLKAELLAQEHNYAFNMPNEHLMKLTWGVMGEDEKGNVYGGALILFFTDEKSKVDFRKSAKQILPIRIQAEDRMLGIPAIAGKGVLSFGLFKQDDPKVDQIKSTKYKQLSKVVSQEVELK